MNVNRSYLSSFFGRLRGALSLGRLRWRSGFVLVTVLDAGREVDSFRASDPEVLVAALRPICHHLPEGDGALRFTGVEEEWLPPGIRRVRREVELDSAEVALSFLKAEARLVAGVDPRVHDGVSRAGRTLRRPAPPHRPQRRGGQAPEAASGGGPGGGGVAEVPGSPARGGGPVGGEGPEAGGCGRETSGEPAAGGGAEVLPGVAEK